MANEQDIERIIALVSRLTPRQRQQLVQRLRASGLLPAVQENDRDRLTKATALGSQAADAQGSAPRSSAQRSAPAPNVQAPASAPSAQPSSSSARLPLRFASGSDEHGRRAGGKVVIGAPSGAAEPIDPHVMPPLPGQAPEQPIGVIFDGGSKGNPGVGYGSYALHWPGQSQQIVQLQFGDGVTNNEAEYDTLTAALEAILKRLAENKANPSTARVEIRGDSQLVINQVLGEWKCNEERMRRRRDRVRNLLREFGSWQLIYHPRANSVRVLGH